MGWVQVEATLSGGMHPQTTPQHKCVMYTEHSFELHSGVAQGCPLSSVLFLCITEALTRLVQSGSKVRSSTCHIAENMTPFFAQEVSRGCFETPWS